MKNKKGFAFIETIITVVILSTSLLLVYSTYNAISNDEKTRIYYDDPAFIYYTNYVKNFLEDNVDMDKIKRDYFNNSYAVVLGNFDNFLYKTSTGKTDFEKIRNNFKINQIVLIKKELFNKCFNASEEDKTYCSLDHLGSVNIAKYINSLSDITYDYTLVIEYSIKLNDSNEYVKCIPGTETKCQSYYASVGVRSSSSNKEENSEETKTLADYIKGLYTIQGANGLYYHDGTLINGIDDGSYRYAGASDSVNNYVCFGSAEETCPDDNLYRIIGVFGDKVKLIKSTRAKNTLLGTDGNYVSNTKYYWNNSSSTNIWSESQLNTVNLNTNYLTNIGSTWSSKIANTTWKVAGNTYTKIRDVVPKTAYQNEITSPDKGSYGKEEEYPAKIGLMYVSDYGFAASPDAWTTTLFNYNNSVNGLTITSLNWMYLGASEWTISRLAGSSEFVSSVLSAGGIGSIAVNSYYGVRPVFYLNSNVTYVSGEGTSTDPIRIN